MSNEEYTMSLDELKELVRFVVFETVREIKQQEHEQLESIKEEEEMEEQLEEQMRIVRTRAAYLTIQLRKEFDADITVVDNADSVEMFICSDDLNNGNSVRLEADSIRVRKNGLSRLWPYESRSEYETALRSVLRWLRSGVGD